MHTTLLVHCSHTLQDLPRNVFHLFALMVSKARPRANAPRNDFKGPTRSKARGADLVLGQTAVAFLQVVGEIAQLAVL